MHLKKLLSNRLGVFTLASIIGLSLVLAWQGKNILWFGVYGGGIVLMLLVLGLAAVWYRALCPSDALLEKTENRWALPEKLSVLGLFGIGFIVCLFMLTGVASHYPLDPYNGDIIPVIKQYVQRFLAGERVYMPFYVAEWSYEAGYLPFMWLPFAIAELLGMDYRVFAFIVFSLGLGLLLWRYVWSQAALSMWQKWAITVIPWIMFGVFISIASTDVGLTVEPLSYGYHLIFLSLATHRKGAVRAGALLLILLSRYMLVLWVPVYLILLLRKMGPKAAILTTLWLGIGILAAWGLFMRHDPLVILRSQASYKDSAVGEWEHKDYSNPENPYHLARGRGVAILFYDADHLPAIIRLQHTQKTVLLAFCVFCAFWAFRKGRKHFWAILYVSALVYILLFLSFLQVPYGYLFGNLTWWAFGTAVVAYLAYNVQRKSVISP